MRFSLNFIKEFLRVDVSAQQLARLLTMAGMEVECFQRQAQDWIFDIEVTSNRYDWLSMVGIAREIAACMGKKIKVTYPTVIRRPVLGERNIVIEDLGDCPFYIGRSIKNVKVTTSQHWLKERLLRSGINSINNIVDITNYCMLKWGNPLHAFDEDKLEGNIYIRRAKKGEVFIGIDAKERQLERENLVIADEKKVIAIAGVMGAKNTEVDENTKNIFLEAAIFSPLTVRRSRRRVGVDTESSYRFERRVNPDYIEYASYEAHKLIAREARAAFAGYRRAGRKPLLKKKKITVSLPKLNSYLGVDFSKTQVKKALRSLGFKIGKFSKEKTVLHPPLFRFDIQREVDVYEEVVRLLGYEKIIARLPFLNSEVRAAALYEFKKELRSLLAMLGLKEVITYSIEAEKDFADLGEHNWVKILNPLRAQENVLRPSLLLGMMKGIRYNLNRNQKNLFFFEIANVYCKEKDHFSELPKLSLGASGAPESIFYLKGVLEHILGYFHIENFEFREQSVGNFTNALKIIIQGKEVGFLGKLDENVRKAFDLKEDIFFSALDITLLKSAQKEKLYEPFSSYPVIWRDISIAFHKSRSFKEARQIIKTQAGEYLLDLQIIDVYKGKDIPSDSFAFTLRIFYQSQKKTLTSEEVDCLHNAIRKKLKDEEGMILR
ncbi:MAG: phenylalanine--tRNA ligase subunit beta [Candidatus Omnitrophota bacterium]|nr:MAG: phenylalanine--tRNA ligase subunit beta [Candidatus Omnitrophota bacterium]